MRFEKALDDQIKMGRANRQMSKSQQWHHFASTKVGHQESAGLNRNKVTVGGLYMFHYDPKWKDTLPFYDTFPIIFPIELTKDGFIGLNLHYLHPRLRARLFDELDKYRSNDKLDKTTKLKISYSILKSTMKDKMFEPCIKRYLSNHVRSSFMYIDPNDWSHAVLLPLQDFKKKTAKQVWDNSAARIRK